MLVVFGLFAVVTFNVPAAPRATLASRSVTMSTSTTGGTSTTEVLSKEMADTVLGLSDTAQVYAESDTFFDAVDADGDDEITLDEIGKYLCDTGYGDGVAMEVFKLLDINSDGAISRAELRWEPTRCHSPVSYRLSLPTCP